MQAVMISLWLQGFYHFSVFVDVIDFTYLKCEHSNTPDHFDARGLFCFMFFGNFIDYNNKGLNLCLGTLKKNNKNVDLLKGMLQYLITQD